MSDWTKVLFGLTPAGLSRHKGRDPDVWYPAIRIGPLKNITTTTDQVEKYQEMWPDCDPILTFRLTEDDLAVCDPQGWIDSGAVVIVDTIDTPDATPGAVSLAAEHGIDLGAITGTGGGGRITKGDVKAAIGDSDG